MTIRPIMIALFVLAIGSILSISVVQYFYPGNGDRNTQPPHPLMSTPKEDGRD